jgi:uncharacterized protein (DUF2141 family)
MVRRLFVAVSFLAISVCTEPVVFADGNDVVKLTITTRNAKGRVFCGLHYTADKFPGHGVDNANAPIVGTTATCEFRGVKPGTVAISAYHDENGNKKFDKGMFGIPTEGYCTSRNAKGNMGPPKFDDAKFTYKGGPLEVTATMIY